MVGRLAFLAPGAPRTAVLAAMLSGFAPFGGLAADAADPKLPAPAAAAIQMLADVTLIDQECRNVSVIFGKAIQASESQGLAVVDVLPLGSLRPRFEAALRQRFAETSHDDLCGSVTAHYAAQIPGLFTAP